MPHSISKGLIFFFFFKLEVHSLHHCTCTAASQEDLGGPRWAAKPGRVCIRKEAHAVNNLSTLVKAISSDANQNFYFTSFSQTALAGPTRQGRTDLKVEVNLTKNQH